MKFAAKIVALDLIITVFLVKQSAAYSYMYDCGIYENVYFPTSQTIGHQNTKRLERGTSDL